MNQLERLHDSLAGAQDQSGILDNIHHFINDQVIPHMTSCIDSCQQHLLHQDHMIDQGIQTCWETTLSFLQSMSTTVFHHSSIVQQCTFDIFQPLLQFYQLTTVIRSRSCSNLHFNKSHNNAENSETIVQYAIQANELLRTIFDLVRDHATPRELISVTMQHIVSIYNSFDLGNAGMSSSEIWLCQKDSLLLLIQLLKHGLKRVPSGKRHMFYSHSFPTIIQRTFCFNINPDSGDPEEMQRLAMEKQMSEKKFSDFVPVLTEFALELSSLFRGVDFLSIIRDSNLLIEHSWILFFCFQVLVKIYSSQDLILQFETSAVVKIMDSIANCNCTFEYILQYFDRHETWHKVKTKMEIEDLEDRAAHMDEEEADSDDEEDDTNSSLRNEINRFVTWDFGGIGIFAYLLFVRGVTRSQYSFGLFTMTHIFHRSRPYIEVMLQNSIPSLSMLAKTFCRFFMDILPNYSLQLRQPERSPARMTEIEKYFSFVQSLINFMARCPDNKERTDSYNILNDFISKLPDDGRFELLSHTLRTCPYPVLLGLMINRLKDEVRLEYDSLLTSINQKINPATSSYKPLQPIPVEEANKLLRETEQSTNILETVITPTVEMDSETIRILRLMGKSSKAFLQKNKIVQLLLDILPKYTLDVQDIDNLDVLIYGLNLLYFLLLRDHAANITGVCDGENTQALLKKLILPLKEKCQLYHQSKSRATLPVEEDEEEFIDDLDLDELLNDPDNELTPDEIETLRELQNEKNSVMASPANAALSQDRIQVELKLFALENVLLRVESILAK